MTAIQIIGALLVLWVGIGIRSSFPGFGLFFLCIGMALVLFS